MAKNTTAVRAASPIATPVLSDKQYMKQMLASIKPAAPSTESSWIDGVAIRAGALVPAVRTFGDTVATSYRYHEAVRKGQL